MQPLVRTRETFRKTERLCSRKVIQLLVEKGRSIHTAPFRLVSLNTTLPVDVPVQSTFTVSKRIFKNATDRNRIKRLMRESFRKNKSSLYSLISGLNTQYALLFIFSGKKILSYSETEEKIKIILEKLVEEIKNVHR